jgi:hypothetical protein
MRMLHDPTVRREIESRLATLRPDSPRQWGSMTPDQMLWHLNQFLEFSLGDGSYERGKMPMPLPIMRFMVMYMPWPKNAPTHPAAKAGATHDFEAERKRCLSLIDRFVTRPIDSEWPEDAAWGWVSGSFASRLQAKHFNHHLSQFNA